MAENLGASFSIDVTSLKAGLATANKLIRESESEFKAAAAGMDDWSKSEDGLHKKLESLNTISDLQKKKVEALQKEYDKLIDEGLDPSSDKAIKLRTNINKETEALNKSKTEIKNTEKALDKLGTESDDEKGKLKTLKDSTDKSTGGFTVMKGALSDLVADGIEAAISGFKRLATAAVDAYKEVDEGSDNVIKATGATGKDADSLRQSYKNVSKSIKGDFGTIGAVLGEVNTRFGFTGETLEDATKQFLKFSNITGTDAKSAVQNVAKALRAAGLDSSNYSLLLDQMTVASQKSGVSVDTLTDGLTKHGAKMRAMGFNTRDTIAILSQFDAAGVNTETALSGMGKAIQNWTTDGKNANTEFTKVIEQIKAAPDNTSAAQIAMENFGKKAGTEMADAVRSGRIEYSDFLTIIGNSEGTVNKTYESTQDGFDDLAITIQNVKTDVSDFVNEIINDYGPQIKDAINGIADTAKSIITWTIEHLPQVTALLAGIVTGILAFKAITIVTQAIAVFRTLYTTLTLVKTGQLALNAAMLANPIAIIVAAIAGLVTAFIVLWNKCAGFRAFWEKAWDVIKNVAKKTWDAISGFFRGAWNVIKAIWDGVVGFFRGVWKGIKAIFSVVGKVLGGFFRGAWKVIKSIWNGVVGFFEGVWNGIKAIFSVVGDVLSGFFSGAWELIKGVFSAVGSFFAGVWDFIKAPFVKAATWFEGIFADAWRFIKGCFDAVGKFFGDTWDFIKAPFVKAADWFGEKFEKVVAAIKKPFEKIKEWAQGVWKGIKSVFGSDKAASTMEAKIEAQTGQKVKLATGGVVRRATSAIIGEDGAEAVMPLEKNTGWIDQLASRLNGGKGGIVINQTNNYSQAHSRYELYKSQQATAKAVKLALTR